MKTNTTKTPAQILSALDWCEVSAALAADTRRMMRAERDALAAALASGDSAKIAAATKEALRVAADWGVDL